jgi:HTH-type transcriptional regulator / antitoxin HigA
MDRLFAVLGISSIEAYVSRLDRLAVQYRHSPKFESSPDHVFVWLQLGVREAELRDLPDYNAELFGKLVRAELRDLTIEGPGVFWPRLVELCGSAGVAVVLKKPFTGTKLSGAAHWTDGGRPIIQLSLRHKSNDHFWWTFFHECGHVLKHPNQTFADDASVAGAEGREAEADAFALDVLVGAKRLAEFIATRPRFESQVLGFSKQLGIHPGIVVGMLQHRKALGWGACNRLKTGLEFAET